jgi:phosphoglycolate phosphatase-like HAD superfamily hydrolase
MPQFGADTIIPRDVQLILMDCFETLIELGDRGYFPRRGISEFLRFFVRDRQVPVVVISDASEELIVSALKQAAVRHLIQGIYHADNAEEILPDGRRRKRLDVPLRDFHLTGPDAVFIGDSPLDAAAAHHHQLPFIRVPRSEDSAFSFASLITGPSRYQSADFTALMLERYRPKAP